MNMRMIEIGGPCHRRTRDEELIDWSLNMDDQEIKCRELVGCAYVRAKK